MSGGFSSSGSVSNQAEEGMENIGGSELSTGGAHSLGMSSSGTNTNQADNKCRTEDDVASRTPTATTNIKGT